MSENINASKEALRKFEMDVWNCSEASLYGVLSALNYDDEDICRFTSCASGFGGGMGGERAVCGALSGGVLAIGCALGRYGSHLQDKALCQRVSGLFRKKFIENFKTDNCALLTEGFEFHSDARRKNCQNMVEFAAEESLKFINKAIQGKL